MKPLGSHTIKWYEEAVTEGPPSDDLTLPVGGKTLN